MTTTYVKRVVGPLFAAAACLCALHGVASAGSFTRGCAARDMQILMMIEERESANAISTEKSRDAVAAMMNARLVCYEGRVRDALELYDSISQSIMLNSVGSSRRKPFRLE
jgi:hypothetical protein